METVEDCITETQTGFQRRRQERRIDEAQLRNRLAGVHAVGDLELAVLAIRAGDIAMDQGETSLWVGGSTDDIKAVARGVCAKTLAHGGKSEEELATDVEMYWHVVAAYLEAGLTDEPGREIGD